MNPRAMEGDVSCTPRGPMLQTESQEKVVKFESPGPPPRSNDQTEPGLKDTAQ